MSSISAGTTSTTTLVHSGDTTGSLVFKTNDTGSGGTTAVTIDTSQNVGVGTTSPSTYANSYAPVLVTGTGSNFATIQGRTDGPSGVANGVSYGGSYSTNPINGARIFVGASGSAGQQGQLMFYTKNTDDNTNQPTERVRIDTSGNVKLSTSGTKILNSSGNPILQQTGSVLQVVQAIYSTAFSTTSTSYVSANLTASITPTSTSSKILCMARYQIGGGSSYWSYVTVLRNSTTDLGGLASGSNVTGSYFASVSDNHVSASYMVLDSPATTSSTSYTLYAKSGNGSSVRVHTDNMPSTMILMEIAA